MAPYTLTLQVLVKSNNGINGTKSRKTSQKALHFRPCTSHVKLNDTSSALSVTPHVHGFENEQELLAYWNEVLLSSRFRCVPFTETRLQGKSFYIEFDPFLHHPYPQTFVAVAQISLCDVKSLLAYIDVIEAVVSALSHNKQEHFTCLGAMTSQAHGPSLYMLGR